MAAQLSDWLTLGRIKKELRIAESFGAYDTTLLNHAREAVSYIEEYTGLPLLDRVVRIPELVPQVPVLLPRMAYVQAVQSLMYRTAYDQPYSESIALGGSPTLEARSPGRVPYWRFWPGVELPDDAQSLLAVVSVGMDAFSNEAEKLKTVLVLLVRAAYNGGGDESRLPAWERILRSATPLNVGVQ